jgi:hypothetical protein
VTVAVGSSGSSPPSSPPPPIGTPSQPGWPNGGESSIATMPRSASMRRASSSVGTSPPSSWPKAKRLRSWSASTDALIRKPPLRSRFRNSTRRRAASSAPISGRPSATSLPRATPRKSVVAEPPAAPVAKWSRSAVSVCSAISRTRGWSLK